MVNLADYVTALLDILDEVSAAERKQLIPIFRRLSKQKSAEVGLSLGLD